LDKCTATRWGIELRNNRGEIYQIGFEKAQNRFFSDRTRAGNAAFSETFAHTIHYAPRMVNDKTMRLHLFFDHASAEMFADDGAVSMTEIFFPSEPFTHARIFGEGGNVRLSKGTVSQLKRIWK
jgi:fructan beta-fructosidase